LAEFAFKGSQAGVEQVPFRDDDNVDSRHGLVTTKNLSYQSFSSVPLDGAAELPCGGDAEPAVHPPGRQRKQREEPAVDLRAVVVDRLVFGTTADPVIAAEARHGRRRLLAADREPLPPFCAPALENQAAVLRAHAHQKPMRARAVPCIRLKSTLSLHRIPSL
jgi:hypothetical protein